MGVLLRVDNLSVRYKGTAMAVVDASLSVEEGRVSVILGANGAGKTSLLRGISGFWRTEAGVVTSGQVKFDGRDITRWSPIATARQGIAIIPETQKVFSSATVHDNLRSVPRMVSKEQYGRLTEAALDLFPILRERRNQVAGYLSGGERQMLAIARALILNPRLLLIDEASLGLAPVAIEAVFSRLERIAKEFGSTILLVEQNIGVAMRIAHQVYAMETGHIVFRGSKDEALSSERIKSSYLGLD